VAEHAHAAAVGHEERRQDGQERRLARAVRAEEAEDRAARDRERDAAQGGRLAPAGPARAERLHHVARVDREHPGE